MVTRRFQPQAATQRTDMLPACRLSSRLIRSQAPMFYFVCPAEPQAREPWNSSVVLALMQH
jgi:hypothetical protein